MIKETMISTVGLPAGGYAIRPKTGFGQMKYRTEHDSVGDKNVPEDAYYGVQTLRAVENFRITGLQMHPEIRREHSEPGRCFPHPGSGQYDRTGILRLSTGCSKDTVRSLSRVRSSLSACA